MKVAVRQQAVRVPGPPAIRRANNARSRCRQETACSAAATDPAASTSGIHCATSTAELRAAAYLRAAAFFPLSGYPQDRSEYSAQSHRRMKADAYWEDLEARVSGKDDAYKHMTVTCIITVIPDREADPISQAAAAEVLSSKIPAGELGAEPCVAVATLDINQGVTLPSEEIGGALPAAPEAATGRAYLSNVCVAEAARGRGLASALVERAAAMARDAGVSHLYVHVEADNAPAVALYQGAGFRIETEETVETARMLQRGRRLLLMRELL